MSQTPGTWSYRPGSWFGIVGAASTLLLPGSEKRRAADLWARIDDGEDFDSVLDALLQTGLGALPAFVLIGTDAAAGTTRLLLRGSAVRATAQTADGPVEVEGPAGRTWVEQSLEAVTALSVEVEPADETAETAAEVDDLTIVDGLVRVSRVSHPARPTGTPAAADDLALLAPPVAVAPVDAAPVDAAPVDAAPVDAAPVDADPVEVGEVEEPLDEPAHPAPPAYPPPPPAYPPPAPATPSAFWPTSPPPEPPTPDPAPVESVGSPAPQPAPQPEPQPEPTEQLGLDDSGTEGEQVGGASALDAFGADPQDADLGDVADSTAEVGEPGEPVTGGWPSDSDPDATGEIDQIDQIDGAEEAPEPAPPAPAWAAGLDLPPPPAPAPSAAPAAPAPPPYGDHDGLTQAGSVGEEPGRPAFGIPGQPPAPDNLDQPVARLVLSHGDTVDVDRVVLIGRAPEARRFTTTDQPLLVTVPSPLHEISSTHVEIRPGTGVDHGSAVVTDMGSTNGTVLVQPGLGPEDLVPGIAVQLIPGATINLGDGVTITVARP